MDLPALVALAAHTQGLLTPGLVLAAGLRREWLSRAARAGRLVLVQRRVYSFAPLPPLPRWVVTAEGVSPAYVLRVRAVLLGLGGEVAARGRTAAALRGWAMLVEPARTVEVVVRHGRHLRPGRHVRCAQAKRLQVEGLRPISGARMLVTTAARTVIDCALELPLLQAVVLTDSALRSGQVSLADLQVLARALPGRRGAERVRRVLSMSDPCAGSVLESVLRVRLHLAGITGYTTQRVVRDALDGYLRRVDFCFDAARLVIEVDGQRWHPDPVLDRQVDNQLAAAGWRVLRFTWAEVVHDPDMVLAQIRHALGAVTPSLHLAAGEDRTAA